MPKISFTLLSFFSLQRLCKFLLYGFRDVLDGIEGLVEDLVCVQSAGLYTQVHLGFRWMGNAVPNKLNISITVEHYPQEVTQSVVFVVENIRGATHVVGLLWG